MVGIIILTVILLFLFTYFSLFVDTNRYYIRIGEIPENEQSKIHRGDAVIGEEKGVSVYDTEFINGKWRIVMPFYFKEGQGQTYEALIQCVTECRYKINKPSKVYLVSGKKVGNGSDGEPVIKNVKIIKDLTEQFKSYQQPYEKSLEELQEMQLTYEQVFDNYIIDNNQLNKND